MSKLIRGLEYVVVALMGVVVAVVIAEVAMRDLADASLIVTDEMSRYLMVWTALLAAVVLMHEDGHIRIGLADNIVGARAARILFVVSQLVVLSFLAIVIVASIRMLPSIGQQNTVTLGVSMAWFYAALPVSFGLLAVVIVAKTISRLRGRDDDASGDDAS